MILVFSMLILMLVLMNFRINSNKLRVVIVYNIFIEIKSIRVFLVKFMLAIVVFLFFN